MAQGKATPPGQIRRYEALREAGWSKAPAAEAAGLSKSWAYNYEKTRPVDGYPSTYDDGAPNYSGQDVVAALRAARGGEIGEEGDDGEGPLSKVLDHVQRRYRFDSSATVWLIELLNITAIWGAQAAKSVGQTYDELVEGFAPYVDDDNDTLYLLEFDYFSQQQEAS